MKKFISVLAAALVATIPCVCLTGCFKVNSFEGEYSYPNPYSPEISYGVKVKVDVQSDKKGDRIRRVQVVDSDFMEASDSSPAYGWDNSVYYEGLESLVTSYRGLYVYDVLTTGVTFDTANPAAPVGVADDGLILSGATQCSGRLLLAVQNALEKATKELGYEFVEGEYSYPNPWEAGSSYGIKVAAGVKEGKIMGVSVVKSDYTEVTAGWQDKNIWLGGLKDLLQSYRNRLVSDVLAQTVTCENSEPKSVSDQSYIITGATLSSGRLLLALQDALKQYA